MLLIHQHKANFLQTLKDIQEFLYKYNLFIKNLSKIKHSLNNIYKNGENKGQIIKICKDYLGEI